MAEDGIVLRDPKKWRAIAHPLRIGILGALANGEMTNEELANHLNVASGKLHFHTRTLLSAGLIEAATPRQKGSITEKPYRRVADRFIVPQIEDGSAPPVMHYIVNAVQFYESTWKQSTDKNFPQFGFHAMFYQTREKENEFLARLKTLMDDFVNSRVNESDPNAHLMSLSGLGHRCPNSELSAT